MRTITLPLLAMFALIACGGAPTPARGPEEVTATWTTGDDAPLGDAPAATTTGDEGAR